MCRQLVLHVIRLYLTVHLWGAGTPVLSGLIDPRPWKALLIFILAIYPL